MAGTFTAKSLADGQVSTSEAALYTVPAATTAYIKQVTLCNVNAVTQTIDVWIRRSGGTSRKVRRFELAQHESADLLDDGDTFEFSTGDSVRAATTTDSAVDFVVMGVEEA